MMISIRLFAARPSGVLFEAIGTSAPWPLASTRLGWLSAGLINAATALARSTESWKLRRKTRRLHRHVICMANDFDRAWLALENLGDPGDIGPETILQLCVERIEKRHVRETDDDVRRRLQTRHRSRDAGADTDPLYCGRWRRWWRRGNQTLDIDLAGWVNRDERRRDRIRIPAKHDAKGDEGAYQQRGCDRANCPDRNCEAG